MQVLFSGEKDVERQLSQLSVNTRPAYRVVVYSSSDQLNPS